MMLPATPPESMVMKNWFKVGADKAALKPPILKEISSFSCVLGATAR